MQEFQHTGVKSFDHELESESFDTFTEAERKALDKEFIRKILGKYSIYAYLLFAGVILITALIIVVCLSFASPYRYLVFIAAGGYIPLGIFLYNILSTTKKKYRYFLFINQKLKSEGFVDYYFRSYMVTLCYRLIIKDLLQKYGYADKYPYLYEHFSTQEKISAFVTYEALHEFLGEEGLNAPIEEIKIEE